MGQALEGNRRNRPCRSEPAPGTNFVNVRASGALLPVQSRVKSADGCALAAITVCARAGSLESDMGFFRTTGQRVGTAGQLFSFFWSNKRWWLTPILITLALFAVVLILAQSSAIAPFIYTFF